MRKFAQNQLPALVWVVIIYWLSSIHRMPNLHIPMADKIAHAGFYGVLCGLTFRAFHQQERFPRLKWFALLAAFSFTVLYGMTDEVHQIYVWGRTSDILDVVADAVGGLLFIAASLLIRRRGKSAGSMAPESHN